MKKLAKKVTVGIIIAVLFFCSAVPSYAAEGTQNLDDMTFEELKIAYLELQLAYEKLKNQTASSQESAEADPGEESGPVLMDTAEFEDDIVLSYQARGIITESCTGEERSAMSTQEFVDYCSSCVTAEEVFYTKYQEAVFTDLNIEYLCGRYIEGLSRQTEACEAYYNTGDADAFYADWNDGYADRAYAIVCLSEEYGFPFGEISEEMREDAAALDNLSDAELADAAVDAADVQAVQRLLNEIGFFCGEEDGILGNRTIRSIIRFQRVYGYEPADGIIDEELYGELETAAGYNQ